MARLNLAICAGPILGSSDTNITLTQPADVGITKLIETISAKRRRVVDGMFLMFFVFFGATLVTFAYLPDLVGVKVYGSINVAYLLAVSQFAVSFLIAAVYALWARKVLDPLTAEARARLAGC